MEDERREARARRVLSPNKPKRFGGRIVARGRFCFRCWGAEGAHKPWCLLYVSTDKPQKKRVPVGKRREKRRPSKP